MEAAQQAMVQVTLWEVVGPAFMKLGPVVLSDPEVLMMSMGEAFSRLTVSMFAALLAHAGVMLVGPSRGRTT